MELPCPIAWSESQEDRPVFPRPTNSGSPIVRRKSRDPVECHPIEGSRIPVETALPDSRRSLPPQTSPGPERPNRPPRPSFHESYPRSGPPETAGPQRLPRRKSSPTRGREHSWRERKSPHSPRILSRYRAANASPVLRDGIGRPSTSATGITPSRLLVRKHSSAFPASSAESDGSPAGDTSFTQARTMPSRAPVWSAGVHSAPQNTKKTLAIDAEIRAPSLLKTRISSKPFFR